MLAEAMLDRVEQELATQGLNDNFDDLDMFEDDYDCEDCESDSMDINYDDM